MDIYRKRAKQYFKDCNKKEYDQILEEALFTSRQAQIAKLKKADNEMPTWEIANLLQVSPETITRELKIIYNKIAKIILI